MSNPNYTPSYDSRDENIKRKRHYSPDNRRSPRRDRERESDRYRKRRDYRDPRDRRDRREDNRYSNDRYRDPRDRRDDRDRRGREQDRYRDSRPLPPRREERRDERPRERYPVERKPDVNNNRIYVGRISRDLNEKDVSHEFGKFGKIVFMRLKEDYAFIEYESLRAAKTAVETLDGKELAGSRLKVQHSFEEKVEKKNTCFVCKQSGHWASECPQNPDLETKCFRCGKMGHRKADCRTRMTGRPLEDKSSAVRPPRKDKPRGKRSDSQGSGSGGSSPHSTPHRGPRRRSGSERSEEGGEERRQARVDNHRTPSNYGDEKGEPEKTGYSREGSRKNSFDNYFNEGKEEPEEPKESRKGSEYLN